MGLGWLCWDRGGVQGIAHRGTGKEISIETTPYIYTYNISTSLGAKAPVQPNLAKNWDEDRKILVGVDMEEYRNSKKEKKR